MAKHPQINGVEYDTELPVIDRDQLDMLLMADDGEEAKALVAEIFDIFKTESAEKLSDLDAICEANDQAELRKIVHFVAGSAGNLGLMRLNGFYRSVEEAIDNGRLTDARDCAAALRTEFEAACVAYQAELM